MTPSAGAANNADTSTPNAAAIFSNVSRDGLKMPLLIRLNDTADTPHFSAKSF